MKALGIDLSSSIDNTAVCLIEIDKVLTVQHIECGCNDEQLFELIASIDVVGIDAPFGWPTEFRRAVTEWRYKEWDPALRDRLRFRLTDLIVKEEVGILPLSVSTDRISLPAMRAMSLLTRLGVADRSGDGRVFEVYPAASLKRWGLPYRRYKKESPAGRDARLTICDRLKGKMNLQSLPEQCQASDHCLDALVAALTAVEAARNRTRRPDADQMFTAKSEGWIHFPIEW